MQQQQRFVLALVASAAVLILWSYLFPPAKPPLNANANANANPQPRRPRPRRRPRSTIRPSVNFISLRLCTKRRSTRAERWLPVGFSRRTRARVAEFLRPHLPRTIRNRLS